MAKKSDSPKKNARVLKIGHKQAQLVFEDVCVCIGRSNLILHGDSNYSQTFEVVVLCIPFFVNQLYWPRLLDRLNGYPCCLPV